MMQEKEVIIIGGGAAGLAAAVACQEKGIEDILIIERGDYLGGILNQCIHDGFGLEKFHTSLSGPEYAQRYIDRVVAKKIPFLLNSMVVNLTPQEEVIVINDKGLQHYRAKVIILAMGCRERTRGAISIPGARPSGIYTAGVAQELINLKNYMVGKKIVILGSGDIGLIMARRLILEGAEVITVAEKLPYSSGLPRNINQCLYDFDIPLLLSHTVVDIQGNGRLSGVTIAQIGKRGGIIPESRRKIICDTLLLSVGLIPENELSLEAGIVLDTMTGGPQVDERGQTNIPGIFACGNVLQVHDIVDNVSLEAEYIVEGVAEYLEGKLTKEREIKVELGNDLRYVVPQTLMRPKDIIFSFRVNQPGRKKILIFEDGKRLIKKKSLQRVNPAEMIRVKLSSRDLEGIKTLKIRLV
ncbi:MAG: pyridine nucleotide-disulfide oxidoreductase [Actinobacteria bacterium RBG_13_35_12]|nr:MAG: pyridine nucleotide-disulfide oxidoreductase [Actinobacteria bacterium RBG_13_35_12]